jgi:hypothetical protein
VVCVRVIKKGTVHLKREMYRPGGNMKQKVCWALLNKQAFDDAGFEHSCQIDGFHC